MPVTVGRGNANEAEASNKKESARKIFFSIRPVNAADDSALLHLVKCGSVENLLSVKGLIEDGEDYTCRRCIGKP